jgi:hypothetical protein
MLGCFIWATIDWILILCKAFTDGQGRRITNWLHPQAGELKTAVSPPANPPSPPPPGGAAPPAASPQPAPMAHEKTPVNGTGKIVAPAVGLMVAGMLPLFGALTAMFFLSGLNAGWLLQPILENLGIGPLSGWHVPKSFSLVILLLKVVPACLILFGGFQMVQLRSYAWAIAAGILAIVCCSLVGFPVGIWALIILARQDVRETFANAARSQSPRTSKWPWGLATAVIMGVIILGLILMVAIVRELRPELYQAGVDAADTSSSSTPEMAIAVPPAPPENAAPAPPPVRIKAGSSRPLTDSEGNLWLADQGFTDGETTERSDHLAIANTEDPVLYQSERYGMTSFAYPVPNGKYVVKLHFAETYDAIKGPGGRVFTFIVEGHEFKDFDVWARAGGAQRACVETVTVEVTDGKLNIYFIHQQENPEINGIEILPAPPAVPIQTDSNALIVPATHGDSSKTLNISSQNGQVVIETTNGRLTTDKVQLQTNPNGSLNLTASKVHYVVAPTPPTSPVAPAPPVPPTPASATMSSQPMTAGTLSEPHVQKTKIIGNLLTKDEFQQDFNRTLPLAANGRLSLDNVNGRIEIAGWDRHEVAIKALKHGKTRESVEAAKIIINSRPDEILIHTEQPSSVTGFPWSWLWFKNSKRNDGIVDYAIQVPQNARLKNISSVNGHIVIEDVSGDIEASTVNGETQISGAVGNLKLSTVNGRIEAQLASLGRGQSVSLDAVNGRIEAILPSNADAQVSASTLNGGISSEFASLVVKKEFPVGSNLKGKLGNGGAHVKASTVNGGIRFRRGKDVQ